MPCVQNTLEPASTAQAQHGVSSMGPSWRLLLLPAELPCVWPLPQNDGPRVFLQHACTRWGAASRPCGVDSHQCPESLSPSNRTQAAAGVGQLNYQNPGSDIAAI